MKFTTKKVEKDFNKINSSMREKIQLELKKDSKLLTCSTKKLRGGNSGYRVKHKKYRIFYKLEDNIILIYRIGQKDRKAYEGM